jgi:nicotinamide mononucleotide transporter
MQFITSINDLAMSTCATLLNYELSWLELVAVVTSLIGVWLGTTGKTITWPWWALSSALYGWLFYEWQLFASAVLQIVFIAAAIWGWIGWGPSGAQSRVATNNNRIVVSLIGTGAVLVLAPWFASIGAAATWPDSFGLVFSIVAQYSMVKEYRESWAIWLIVDAVYSIEYATQKLYFTSILYVIFTGIALRGWLNWKSPLNSASAVQEK